MSYSHLVSVDIVGAPKILLQWCRVIHLYRFPYRLYFGVHLLRSKEQQVVHVRYHQQNARLRSGRCCREVLDVRAGPALDALEASALNEHLLSTVSPYVTSFWVTVQREVKPTHWSLEAFPVLRPPPGQPDEGWRSFELGLRVRTLAVGLQEN